MASTKYFRRINHVGNAALCNTILLACRGSLKLAIIPLLAICILSCTKSRVKSACHNFLKNTIELSDLSIDYPKKNTLFPIDFQTPTFKWTDSSSVNSDWFTCISDTLGNLLLSEFVRTQEWKPDSLKWETLKQNRYSEKLQLTVIGFSKKDKALTGCTQLFQISEDSVGADIFFRAVTLPFSYAVRNVQTIEWYMGSVRGGAPRKMLDNMPVCANCHSFSGNGPTLAMDVDYGNDKGSYILVRAEDTCSMKPENIISWGNFKKEEGDPTFGLLSQISPSGKYVLSTVKDLSVFAAVDDNLAYSQLFFPIQGIIGIYTIESKSFSELQGANDPTYVQSNPVWAPDNKNILFARTNAYINEKVKKYGNALLNINDVKEFKKGHKEFKFDIYSVDFNKGMGGIPHPLKGASFNGNSNYFPKYSPDGKWIVFCQAENFMLLQPDSKLYIMKADGTNARRMTCNMENMNSWHSWSPNGHWLVFSSKEESLYTCLYLTHIDENGNDSPPILLENLLFDKRAANIPEFFPGNASDFVKIKDDFSNSAPYYTRLAMDNIQSHYYVRADQNLKRAIALDPNYIDAYLVRILLNSILLQVNSRTEKAEKVKALSIVDNLISKNKEDNELLFLKATLLSANGDDNEASTILNSILTKSSGFYKAYDLLATVYKNSGKSDQVIPIYNKMKALIPSNDLEINLLIAKYNLSKNKADDALILLKRMSEKYPSYDELHENLWSIYLGKKDIKAAQYEINLLLGFDSTNYKYYFMNSEIAEIAGDHNKATEYNAEGNEWLQIKLDQNKEDIPLAFEKANILQKNKDFKGALAIYNNVLINLPANYQALKEKARIMLIMQQWLDAIKLYEELLNNYTPEEEFYNNAAIAFINTGNYEEALNRFSHTLELNHFNIDALYNRAKLYKTLGNMQKANNDLDNMKEILRTKKSLTADEKQLLKYNFQ
jgi:tetratricopeptide (TPR) repeat protein